MVLRPTAWLPSIPPSPVHLEGIKGLRESRDGLGVVAKAYSVSPSPGMCFSQLDDPSCHEARPDLGQTSSLVPSWGVHNPPHPGSLPTPPAWGKSTGNDALPLLLCTFSVVCGFQ